MVVAEAAPGGGSSADEKDATAAPTEPAEPTVAGGFQINRRAVVNAVIFGLSLPLWRDVIHDLGFLEGEVGRCKAASSTPA